MSVFDALHSGKPYSTVDDVLVREQALCLEKLCDYNATRPLQAEKRAELLKEMFAEIGENCYIEPPLHANWAGKFVHFGKTSMRISISRLWTIRISM